MEITSDNIINTQKTSPLMLLLNHPFFSLSFRGGILKLLFLKASVFFFLILSNESATYSSYTANTSSEVRRILSVLSAASLAFFSERSESKMFNSDQLSHLYFLFFCNQIVSSNLPI